MLKNSKHSEKVQIVGYINTNTRLLARLKNEIRKSVPLQARSGPDCSRKLRFPDFVTTAQDGGRLSALRTGRL